jgi:predicted metal-dependent enzyme (double-stranded beta helix superfamily)
VFAVPENTVALPAVTPAAAHPGRIAMEVARDRARWSSLLRYDPDNRFAALVESTEHFQIWLLSWLPGQQTDLHDHGTATGAFTVVSGTLAESVRRPGRPELTNLITPGQSRVFGPGYVHLVHNTGPDPAVSIHVYSPQRTHRSLP